MFNPDEALERLRASHNRLLSRLENLTDELARQPSLLPGWSVGHVLTHLARNADSVVHRLQGAARDEVVDQYPGGPAGRNADIEAGAGRSAADLVTDVRQAGLAVEHEAAGLPGEAWGRLSRDLSGALSPAEAVLLGRIREVEVHHVDLGLGYRPADWPVEFVTETLASELPKLGARADPAQLLGWLTGRGPAPTLPAWR
jgi:maleylpyruvate isomerase